MALALMLTGLVVVALLPLVQPILRHWGPEPDRGTFDRAVYRDQLQELDRELARGLMTEAEAGPARLEIQRRLLAADTAPVEQPGWMGRSPVLASVLIVFVAGGAIGLYERLGATGRQDVVFAPRPAVPGAMANAIPVPERPDLVQEAARLADRLKADPSDGEQWVLLARTSGRLRHWDQAADAYRHALALGQTGPDLRVGLGETLVMQADGIVTPAARDAFVAALSTDAKNEVARYYMALATGQAGQPEAAIGAMQGLLADSPEDSPMREEIRDRINEMAKAAGLPVPELAEGTPAAEPDADDAIDATASLPEGEQKVVIAGMVEKLTARAEADPGDADGWMRLGRAYAVMRETDKAADAFDRAVALKPGDVAIRLQAVEGLLNGLKPDDALPPRVITLLKQVEAIAPDEQEVLWYLGVAAAREARPDEARGYWSRLLVKLPPEGVNTRIVRAAMGSLRGS